MDFSWSPEQKMIKEAAREFLEKECPKSLVKEMMADEVGHLPDVWKKMAELGWLGLIFDQQYGGSAGSYMDLIVLLEEMGRAMLPGPFFSSVVMAGLIIAEGGSEVLQSHYLPSLCSGNTILTFALTEQEGSWPCQFIQTMAERQKDSYLLTGRKMFVTDAHLAQTILVVARAGNSKGPLIILACDTRSPGVMRHPLKTIAGDKQFEVVFDRVRISHDQRIGEEGEGIAILQRVLPKMITAFCARMVGGMERIIEVTVQYAKERKQFGVPIGMFQAIQHYCADMLSHLETARLLTHQAAWKSIQNLPCLKETSMAKAICSESLKKIVATAHQIHGAIGFTHDHDLHIYSKHAKGWELMMGNAVEHRSIVAEEMGLQP